MRFAFCANPLLDRGVGIGVYAAHLLGGLLQAAPEDEFLLFFNTLKRRAQAKIRAQDYSVRSIINHPLGWFLSRGWDRGTLPPIEAFIGAVDLVHEPNFLVPPTRKAKRVATIHDLTALLFPEWHTETVRAYAPRLRRFSKTYDLLLTVSHATKRDIVEHLGIPPERIRVTHLGIAEEFRLIPRSEAQVIAKKYGIQAPYLLFAGTLEPRKNVGRLLEAFAMSEEARDHQLVLVGTKGWLNEEIRMRIEALGSRVLVAGFVEEADLAAIYAGADLFLYPSLYEGFGLPPLEAMACGVPVLTSDVSSLPEVTGGKAVFVDPRDVEAISYGIDCMLRDSTLRHRLSKEGLTWSAQFRWRKTAEETLQAYRELL